jgi:hypothetical protein
MPQHTAAGFSGQHQAVVLGMASLCCSLVPAGQCSQLQLTAAGGGVFWGWWSAPGRFDAVLLAVRVQRFLQDSPQVPAGQSSGAPAQSIMLSQGHPKLGSCQLPALLD